MWETAGAVSAHHGAGEVHYEIISNMGGVGWTDSGRLRRGPNESCVEGCCQNGRPNFVKGRYGVGKGVGDDVGTGAGDDVGDR